MDCNETRRWLDAHADGELDLGRSADLEAHLAACPTCGRAAKAVGTRSNVLRERLPGYPASSRLRSRVRSALRAGAQPQSERLWLPWLAKLSGALACAAALVATGYQWSDSRRSSNALLNEAIANHVRSLQANHLTDVASSDQHTVKPWFAGKLDFSLPVTDFASQGFPLAGGRLDRFGGRDVATLIYRRGQHVVNVFVWPEGGAASPSETQSRGYHMLEWRSGGLTYLAISDTAIDELHRLSGLLGAKN